MWKLKQLDDLRMKRFKNLIMVIQELATSHRLLATSWVSLAIEDAFLIKAQNSLQLEAFILKPFINRKNFLTKRKSN
jgi:hypothetical protein